LLNASDEQRAEPATTEKRPDHAGPADRRSGSRYWPILAVVMLVAAYPLIVSNSYFRYVGVLTVMYMVLATAWNLMGGFTGYISLGHVAFFGVGAYGAALLVTRTGLHNVPAVLVAGVITAVAGAAIGYVALRVRGSSFVIVTIALVYIGGLLVQAWGDFTGGSSGIILPSGFDGSRADLHQYYHWQFALLLLGVLSLWWFIDRSKFGMGLKAVREDEDKAQSLGVDTAGFKLTAFTLSAGFTGLGGGLYASWFGFLDPIFTFDVLVGTQIVLMALLGGIRSLWGPVIGALILIPSTEYFLVRFGESQLHLVVTGLLLAVVVLLMPDGIIMVVRRALARRHAPAASIREQQPGRAADADTSSTRAEHPRTETER
jgi:branched-chain amino acid transport system permease protein